MQSCQYQEHQQIHDLEFERDALRKEVERLSGKTGFCVQCEAYAKEVEELKQIERKNYRYHIDTLEAKDSEIARLRHCLKYIELTGAEYGHFNADPGNTPCGCGGCMSNEAAKGLGQGGV